jgi:AcrR family transcriptional regulator
VTDRAVDRDLCWAKCPLLRLILQAAADLLARGGPGHVSIDEVAAAAGVGKGTVFRRFGSRAGLMHALVEQHVLDLDVARSIDLSKITVTERKASLLIDTARAFLQWGKHEKAYLALRAAEETAPEEVAGRPSVQRLVRELVISAPPTVRRDAEHFACRIGAAR